MVLTLCKLCIGIIYKLSDQILDWLSSGVGCLFGDSDLAAVIGESLGNMKSGAASLNLNAEAGYNEYGFMFFIGH